MADWPRTLAWAGAGVALAAVVTGIAVAMWPRPAPLDREGLPSCPPSALEHLLADDAVACWFEDAELGPWRATSAVQVRDMIIVHVDGASRLVADVVARRLIEQHRATAAEILVYARQAGPPRSGATIRRARWTPRAGLQVDEFLVP